MTSAIASSISRVLMTRGRGVCAGRLGAGDAQRLHDLREMAGARMTLPAVDQRRLLLRTDRLRLPAARAEPAARRRIRGAGHVALEDDPLALPSLRRLFDRHRGEERLRVRMRGPLVDVLLRAELDDLAEVHDGDAVRDVPDEREIVRNEEVSE